MSSGFGEKKTKILPEENFKTRKYTRLKRGCSIRDAFLVYQVGKNEAQRVPYMGLFRIESKIGLIKKLTEF